MMSIDDLSASGGAIFSSGDFLAMAWPLAYLACLKSPGPEYVGLGLLYNILSIASKLHNFHNLRTIYYVSIGLRLKSPGGRIFLLLLHCFHHYTKSSIDLLQPLLQLCHRREDEDQTMENPAE